MHRYFIIYKPYKMLSQFARVKKKRCLADIEFAFPEGTNALGRLDDNSEGLLILTNDKAMNALLLKPENAHKRVYHVQVHGRVEEEALAKLKNGVSIRLEGSDYRTKPCAVKVIEPPENLPPRAHPVRDDIRTTWLEITLTEGKFHQVRKMTAVVGHQTMRLLRVSIEELQLHAYVPGSVKEIRREEIYHLLHIKIPVQ